MKRTAKSFFTLFAIVLMCVSLTRPAMAEEDESILKARDLPKGAISLTLELEDGGIPIADAAVRAYRVAVLSVKNYNVFYEPLLGDYSYSGISASESNQIAAELADSTDLEKLKSFSVVTNEEGLAHFYDLDFGMYLVVQEDEGLDYVFEPFIISVPLAKEEGSEYVWEENVVSSPKVISGSIPVTGDDENLPLWTVCLFASLAAAALGAALLLVKKS